MKKTIKAILIILLVLVVIGGAIGGYFIWKHSTSYIGEKAAKELALADAGLSVAAVKDMSAEFDHSKATAWYDVDFESQGMEYEYSIDAVTGEVLYSYSQPEHDD